MQLSGSCRSRWWRPPVGQTLELKLQACTDCRALCSSKFGIAESAKQMPGHLIDVGPFVVTDFCNTMPTWKPQSEGLPSAGLGVQCGSVNLQSFISCRHPSPAVVHANCIRC